MTCSVKSSNSGIIFEPCTKSSHDIRKNTFFSDVMRDFVLASKMKLKFEFWTPPYFCDIGIFDKVSVTLTIFKQKVEKGLRSFTLVFCSS